MGEKKIEVLRKRTIPRECSKEQKDAASQDIIHIVSLVLKKTLKSPEQLKITCAEGPSTLIFEVDIAHSDFGRLVGARGKYINAIRVIVQSIGATYGFRAIVKIKNEERFYESEEVAPKSPPADS